jgi:hypothetical protein
MFLNQTYSSLHENYAQNCPKLINIAIYLADFFVDGWMDGWIDEWFVRWPAYTPHSQPGGNMPTQ